MSREAFCQLTAGDANVLMSLLESANARPSAFSTLLREKLNHSNVFFREDIPGDVVTLDTQVLYTINGAVAGPHVLLRDPADGLPDAAISVRTMRGLALLGLGVGESIEILGEGAEPEALTVQSIIFQPEADARSKQRQGDQVELVDHAPQVINFRPRPRQIGTPYDDDPGPSAA
ncbi:transcription elongation factor GreAB [Rhizobium sp. GN54]|uniref:transcription elongation factor GreAB n=1 Tax=Rhizobium sp. GN54 TaxID=2898150 RepID=UPI001E4A87DA|nr:transcription elongation factor GreAB [Rhizobium sp. GN54]MCD2182658.1 transcription elongation factor GreAB [Rhizobium sp. GN54]